MCTSMPGRPMSSSHIAGQHIAHRMGKGIGTVKHNKADDYFEQPHHSCMLWHRLLKDVSTPCLAAIAADMQSACTAQDMTWVMCNGQACGIE